MAEAKTSRSKKKNNLVISEYTRIEGEFLAVYPTDGTSKYDVPGNLYLDIPIDEINQYVFLIITRDKKAEDVLFKISLN
jgi:hypothetical protein